MSHPELTEEHRDALQEVANIAMGEAGASLAELLGVFVRLSVPRIQTLDAAVVPQALASLLGSGRMVTAVRQSFSSRVAGEAIVFFGEAGCAEIAGLMGYDQVLNAAERREVLLDITNVLVGACLGRIFQQFGIEPGFSPPSVLAEDVAVERLLHTDRLDWSHALLVEVNFSLEQSAFVSHLVMLLPEHSIDNIRASLEQLIAAL